MNMKRWLVALLLITLIAMAGCAESEKNDEGPER